MKWRYFKIYRAFSISFNPLNVGNFFKILKDCTKVQEKKALSCVHFPHKTRPHESRSSGTAYLIFASTRIRCDVSGSDSTIHTDTLLRFTFAIYWPVQLSGSMLKWNPRLWFRAFVNVVVAISSTHEHNGHQSLVSRSPLPSSAMRKTKRLRRRLGQACLYVVSTTSLFVRWTNPKSSLRIQKNSRFTRFRLELKDSTIWIWLGLVLKWLIVVVKIAAEGR